MNNQDQKQLQQQNQQPAQASNKAWTLDEKIGAFLMATNYAFYNGVEWEGFELKTDVSLDEWLKRYKQHRATYKFHYFGLIAGIEVLCLKKENMKDAISVINFGEVKYVIKKDLTIFFK